MDNQKPQQGNGSNIGNEGSGSSMGKDLNKDIGGNDHVTSKTVGHGNLDHGIDKSPAQSLDKSPSQSLDKSSTQSADKSTDKPQATTQAKSLDQQLDKSAADMHKTIDKAAEAAKPMADRLATTAHTSVDKMSSALTDASARLDEKSKQLQEAYGRFADTGRDYVRSSPATSVLIALAAGYTLSKLLGRR